MSKNVVFVTFLCDFSTKKAQKKRQIVQHWSNFYLFFLRFYRCFFKTVRHSVMRIGEFLVPSPDA